MSKLDTPEHAAYRAKMLAYGATGPNALALELEVTRLRADLLDMERMYLETDAELYEYERRYGKQAVS